MLVNVDDEDEELDVNVDVDGVQYGFRYALHRLHRGGVTVRVVFVAVVLVVDDRCLEGEDK